MIRSQFMLKLEYFLQSVSEKERNDILYDYAEHFEAALANGKTEEEIVKELGDPRTIVEELLGRPVPLHSHSEQSYPNYPIQERSSLRPILMSILLIFFNLIFVLGPVMGVFGVYITFCAISVGFILSPIAGVVGWTMFHQQDGLLMFFMSMTLCSLGVLIGVAVMKIGKLGLFILKQYVQYNLKWIRGE